MPRSGDASKTGEDRSAYRRNPGGSGGPDKKGDVGAGTGDVEFVCFFAPIIALKLKFIFFSSVEDSVVVQDLSKHIYVLYKIIINAILYYKF